MDFFTCHSRRSFIRLSASVVSHKLLTIFLFSLRACMENLNTYNQTRTLSTLWPKRLFQCLIGFSILILAVSLLLRTMVMIPATFVAAITGAALLLILASGIALRNLVSRCRLCGRELSYVFRPFTFNERFLSMSGIKDGNFFYMPRQKMFASFYRQQWQRVSKQSPACHHCRLIQQGHHIVAEAVDSQQWHDLLLKYPEHSLTQKYNDGL